MGCWRLASVLLVACLVAIGGHSEDFSGRQESPQVHELGGGFSEGHALLGDAQAGGAVKVCDCAEPGELLLEIGESKSTSSTGKSDEQEEEKKEEEDVTTRIENLENKKVELTGARDSCKQALKLLKDKARESAQAAKCDQYEYNLAKVIVKLSYEGPLKELVKTIDEKKLQIIEVKKKISKHTKLMEEATGKVEWAEKQKGQEAQDEGKNQEAIAKDQKDFREAAINRKNNLVEKLEKKQMKKKEQEVNLQKDLDKIQAPLNCAKFCAAETAAKLAAQAKQLKDLQEQAVKDKEKKEAAGLALKQVKIDEDKVEKAKFKGTEDAAKLEDATTTENAVKTTAVDDRRTQAQESVVKAHQAEEEAAKKRENLSKALLRYKEAGERKARLVKQSLENLSRINQKIADTSEANKKKGETSESLTKQAEETLLNAREKARQQLETANEELQKMQRANTVAQTQSEAAQRKSIMAKAKRIDDSDDLKDAKQSNRESKRKADTIRRNLVGEEKRNEALEKARLVLSVHAKKMRLKAAEETSHAEKTGAEKVEKAAIREDAAQKALEVINEQMVPAGEERTEAEAAATAEAASLDKAKQLQKDKAAASTKAANIALAAETDVDQAAEKQALTKQALAGLRQSKAGRVKIKEAKKALKAAKKAAADAVATRDAKQRAHADAKASATEANTQLKIRKDAEKAARLDAKSKSDKYAEMEKNHKNMNKRLEADKLATTEAKALRDKLLRAAKKAREEADAKLKNVEEKEKELNVLRVSLEEDRSKETQAKADAKEAKARRTKAVDKKEKQSKLEADAKKKAVDKKEFAQAAQTKSDEKKKKSGEVEMKGKLSTLNAEKVEFQATLTEHENSIAKLVALKTKTQGEVKTQTKHITSTQTALGEGRTTPQTQLTASRTHLKIKTEIWKETQRKMKEELFAEGSMITLKVGGKSCGTDNVALPLERTTKEKMKGAGGKDYRGYQTKTRSQRNCQSWDTQKPHKHRRTKENHANSGLERNYCRNPDKGKTSIWCYTTDKNKRWEYCDPQATSEKLTGKGADYRGIQTKTKSGKECQKWDTQKPHKHDRTNEKYSNSGLDENYCRNPDGESSIWCYTEDKQKRWEFCVPVSVDTNKGRLKCDGTGTELTVSRPEKGDTFVTTCPLGKACNQDIALRVNSVYYGDGSSRSVAKQLYTPYHIAAHKWAFKGPNGFCSSKAGGPMTCKESSIGESSMFKVNCMVKVKGTKISCQTARRLKLDSHDDKGRFEQAKAAVKLKEQKLAQFRENLATKEAELETTREELEEIEKKLTDALDKKEATKLEIKTAKATIVAKRTAERNQKTEIDNAHKKREAEIARQEKELAKWKITVADKQEARRVADDAAWASIERARKGKTKKIQQKVLDAKQVAEKLKESYDKEQELMEAVAATNKVRQHQAQNRVIAMTKAAQQSAARVTARIKQQEHAEAAVKDAKRAIMLAKKDTADPLSKQGISSSTQILQKAAQAVLNANNQRLKEVEDQVKAAVAEKKLREASVEQARAVAVETKQKYRLAQQKASKAHELAQEVLESCEKEANKGRLAKLSGPNDKKSLWEQLDAAVEATKAKEAAKAAVSEMARR